MSTRQQVRLLSGLFAGRSCRRVWRLSVNIFRKRSSRCQAKPRQLCFHTSQIRQMPPKLPQQIAAFLEHCSSWAAPSLQSSLQWHTARWHPLQRSTTCLQHGIMLSRCCLRPACILVLRAGQVDRCVWGWAVEGCHQPRLHQSVLLPCAHCDPTSFCNPSA
jgi:hypothetical protein